MLALKSMRKSQFGMRGRCVALALLAGGMLMVGRLQAQRTGSSLAEAGVVDERVSGAALPEAPSPVEAGNGPVLNSPRSFAGPGNGEVGFPTLRQRERHLLLDLVGPTSFIAPGFQAGIDTVRPLGVGYPADGFAGPGKHPAHGDVPEWGEGAQGYAKRYADRFGQGLVSTTSRYALGEILREDVTYHRCACTGLLPRTAHALVGAYTAHTRSGRAIASLPAFAAPFVGSEIAVAAWYPTRYDASDALRISVLNYVAAPFRDLFAEFVGR